MSRPDEPLPTDDGRPRRDGGAPDRGGDLPARERVRRILAGDQAAFLDFAERHRRALFRLALAYVHDPDAAREVVQQTWTAFLEGLPRFAFRSSLKTWLFGILLNQARRHHSRRAQRGVAPAPRDAAEDASAEEPELNEGWRSPGWRCRQTPEDAALGSELRDRLSLAIADLPVSQQRVLLLRDVEGWSAAEVCQLLGVSAGNQRVLLHRARKRLRARLARYVDGEEGG